MKSICLKPSNNYVTMSTYVPRRNELRFLEIIICAYCKSMNVTMCNRCVVRIIDVMEFVICRKSPPICLYGFYLVIRFPLQMDVNKIKIHGDGIS